MRGTRKPLVALLCAVLLCCSCLDAGAEFSPRYEALSREGGATLTLEAQAETLYPLSEESLNIVNGWLEGLALILTVNGDTQASAMLDGETLMDVTVRRQNGYTVTSFAPSGGVYLTDEGEDALHLLTGKASVYPDVRELLEAYQRIAPAFFPILAGETAPKTVKDATSIKNASASAAYENYLFKDGAMNSVWSKAAEEGILPVLKETLRDRPDWYRLAEETLLGMEFSGESRVKRFLDKDLADMGLQLTGQAAIRGEKRKITLFGGYTPGKGGYVSLSLPAVKGKNSLKITFGGKLTEKNGVRTLTLDGAYACNQDGISEEMSLSASLKNAVKDGREDWSGKITLTVTRNKEKAVWTLTPEMAFTEEGLQGNITVQKKVGKSVRLKATVRASLKAPEEISAPMAYSAKDLRGLSPEEARVQVQAEWIPLTEAIARLISHLPQEARALLLHDLRTDAWMNGPDAPVLTNQTQQETTFQAAPADSWEVVEEDEQQ